MSEIGPEIGEATARALLRDYLPAAALERLAPLVTPARIRARRLEERDAAIRELAAYYPLASSGRALAAAMRVDLQRLASRGARSLSAAHRAALGRVLELAGGRSPSETVLRDALAGLGSGRNSPPDSGHASRDTPSQGAADPLRHA